MKEKYEISIAGTQMTVISDEPEEYVKRLPIGASLDKDDLIDAIRQTDDKKLLNYTKA